MQAATAASKSEIVRMIAVASKSELTAKFFQYFLYNSFVTNATYVRATPDSHHEGAAKDIRHVRTWYGGEGGCVRLFLCDVGDEKASALQGKCECVREDACVYVCM